MAYPKNWKCPNCGKKNKSCKTCSKCGFSYDGGYPKVWTCPNCGKKNRDTIKCKKCDYPKSLRYPKLWHCPKCGKLIKSHSTCPYCKKSKTFAKKFVVIACVLFILLLIVSLTQKKDVNDSIVVFNTSKTSIELPSWKLIDLTEDSIRLYDEESSQSIYFFTNEPYFTSTRKEVYNVFDNINENFELNITNEYSFNEWEVLCFSNKVFEMCLSGTNCEGTIVYLQFTNYALNLNQTLYHNILDSFYCFS